MVFGIGYGWNKEEMEQHGTRYGERRAILRDRIMAMKSATRTASSWACSTPRPSKTSWPGWPGWPSSAQRAVLTMPQGPRDEVLAELERLSPLIDALSDA